MPYNIVMKDILAYYTKDGSVGLYDCKTEDIYHSVYGAYSEAYDKFIIPADINFYLNKTNRIKVLDLCYGIGYNTKSFLNYFLENFSQEILKNNLSLTTNIATIDTNNILSKNNNKKSENFPKKYKIISFYNAQIDTNNIFKEFLNDFIKNRKNIRVSYANFEKINRYDETKNKKFFINIDAVDYNETLMKLSPFFANKNRKYKSKSSGIKKVDKFLEDKKFFKNIYKHHQEVDMILLMALIKKYGENFLDEIIEAKLTDKRLKKFFNEEMVDFLRFYQNKRYKLSPKRFKSTFLHNIYYRYISICYKNSLKVLKNNKISIKYINDDARNYLKNNFNRYDLIFLDAFTPTLAPELWSYEFIKLLYSVLNFDGKILTYSSSASIRNAFLENNFYVGKIFNEHENKFTGTIATKNKELIKYPLDEFDLGLVRSKAGITYKDKNLNSNREEILERRKTEIDESDLISTTQFIKKFKGEHYNDL